MLGFVLHVLFQAKDIIKNRPWIRYKIMMQSFNSLERSVSAPKKIMRKFRRVCMVCIRSMGRYVPPVVIIQCFSRDSVKKLTKKDAQKSPCQVQRLEDISSIISPLRDKFAFKFVQEFKVKLQINILSIELERHGDL